MNIVKFKSWYHGDYIYLNADKIVGFARAPSNSNHSHIFTIDASNSKAFAVKESCEEILKKLNT